jgi:hypothetical protein
VRFRERERFVKISKQKEKLMRKLVKNLKPDIAIRNDFISMCDNYINNLKSLKEGFINKTNEDDETRYTFVDGNTALRLNRADALEEVNNEIAKFTLMVKTALQPGVMVTRREYGYRLNHPHWPSPIDVG